MVKLRIDKVHNDNYKRIIRAVCILAVCLFFIGMFNNSVYAVPSDQTEANELSEQQDDTWETVPADDSTENESSLQDLRREYEQVKKEADANTGTVKKLASEIREMNLRLSDEAKLIEKAHKELNILDTKIEYAERSLIEYEEDMAVEKDHLYNSIKMEYEDGDRSLLSLFLNVDRFSELADRIEYSNRINSYINEKMNDYQFMMDMASKTRDRLDELKKQRQEELVEYDRKKAKFKQSIDEMSDLMKDAKAKAENANSFAEELENEIALMEAEERMILIKNGYSQDAYSSNVTYIGDGTQFYYKSPYPHTDSELVTLAGIIEAEAGNSHYPGMVAVGSVVMNRVESTRFDNTIEGVIYADMQFEPVRTGRLAYILARGPADSCMSVAKEVLDGKRNVPNLYFKSEKYAAEHNIEGVNIGGNVFH
ncbi:MAG: cell wall hydrolase [Lachnospiraceae bacterium]|nr:cell wall hydrolase [Lachnospiraceae bacterium]